MIRFGGLFPIKALCKKFLILIINWKELLIVVDFVHSAQVILEKILIWGTGIQNSSGYVTIITVPLVHI